MINDPAVRALSNDLSNTFRRMEAIEGRCAASIATLKEEPHEHKLDTEKCPSTPVLINLAAGEESAVLFSPTIAYMLDSLGRTK